MSLPTLPESSATTSTPTSTPSSNTRGALLPSRERRQELHHQSSVLRHLNPSCLVVWEENVYRHEAPSAYGAKLALRRAQQEGLDPKVTWIEALARYHRLRETNPHLQQYPVPTWDEVNPDNPEAQPQ